MTARRIRFLAADIWEMAEDGNRYEVIDGELYVTPPPGVLHQLALTTLATLIDAYVSPRELGAAVVGPIAVILGDHSAVQPDIVYISRERVAIITERAIDGAPDLMVEVLSPHTATCDRTVKLRRYARAGIPHYWIYDPDRRTLEAYRLGVAGYELTGTYGPGTVFRPDLFPGLEISIDELGTWPGQRWE